MAGMRKNGVDPDPSTMSRTPVNYVSGPYWSAEPIMSERAFVRPADGLEVRHPDGRHLADEGGRRTSGQHLQEAQPSSFE